MCGDIYATEEEILCRAAARVQFTNNISPERCGMKEHVMRRSGVSGQPACRFWRTTTDRGLYGDYRNMTNVENDPLSKIISHEHK